ncbi:MAG: CHAD domain-containing protein [Planctomycetota bacterium]|nr:CHAD domain-containing protein [Planctomycetota bacterium]
MIAPTGDVGRSSAVGTDPDAERHYALASPALGERALELLRARFRTRDDALLAVTRAYYDTFDRRLAGEDAILCRTLEDGAHSLRLESLSGGLVRRLATPIVPGFAADLPRGPFHDAIAPLIDVRRLLQLVEITGSVERASVLDDRGKTTVRLSFEQWTIGSRADRIHGADITLLTATPVKGYGKAARRVCELLEAELALHPLPPGALLSVFGVAPQSAATPAATRPAITRDMRSDEAIKRIYASLLETIVANEEGTRRRTDPEFLHQFRVAIRRTRAGIARLRGVFPVRTMERFKREFAWLGSVTGPMRDLDVHLMELPAYEAALPPEARGDLEPLRTHLELSADREQVKLEAALESERYARLIKSWRAWLRRPVPMRTPLVDARRPIEQLARERIYKLHGRVLKRGSKIDDQTPDEAVHDLRLDCKKLRYLIEFFRDLFDPKVIKQQIRALKQLQEVLGRFNDFSVQQIALADATHEMAEHGRAPLATAVVVGRLIETLRGRQQQARDEVRGRIQTFNTPDNRARAEQLFAPTAPVGTE